MSDFVIDVKALRQSARQHMERGPITETYGADSKRVIEVLNDVLATEIVCYLRYKRHHYAAKGINSSSIADEFLEHANEEMQHADWVAERITQLQGEPDFNPGGLLTRSHAEYVEGNSLTDMIKEDLVAERIAISSYQEISRWLGEGDPTTRDIIKKILAVEEEHADDLLTLLEDMGEKTSEKSGAFDRSDAKAGSRI